MCPSQAVSDIAEKNMPFFFQLLLVSEFRTGQPFLYHFEV
jgi:hypothetical protein